MFLRSHKATVLVHFDHARHGAWWDEPGASGELPSECDVASFQWYVRHVAGSSRAPMVLLPSSWRTAQERLVEAFAPHPIVWFEDEVELPPRAGGSGTLWVINGRRAPIIDWVSAGTVRKRNDCDIVVFSEGTGLAHVHYPESVVVDEAGRVLRFRRHYFDSPAFAETGSGQAAFLAVSPKIGPAVVNQIVARGWGLENLGAITLRFQMRWSDKPCLFGGAQRRPEVIDDDSDSHPEAGIDPQTHDDPLDCRASGSAEPRLCDSGDPQIADDAAYRAVKRALDLLAAFAGIAVLSPLLVLTALLIKLTSRGPVLFGHRRQGLGGEEFTCWKFRSMKVGADALQAKLRSLNEVDGPQFKIKRDPRITWIGAFIRKTNIDELPQLFNVLSGRMSLVGPRPSPDRENQLCPAWRRARLSVKPGITGLWQVLRRRDGAASDFQEWIYYDTEYARQRSLWLDLHLLAYTPVAILAPKRTSRFVAHLRRYGICPYSPLISGAEAIVPSPETPQERVGRGMVESDPHEEQPLETVAAKED